MRTLGILVLSIFLFACNGENVPDCFQNSGDIVEREFQLEPFTKITTYPRIELILTDAPEQSVIVQTGEYLINDIDVRVVNDRLELVNNNSCNLTRDYGITKVFVSAPQLTEIRNGSGLPIRSDNVLSYDRLDLVSENFTNDEDFNSDGDFILELDCDVVNININNLSNCFISGFANQLYIGFYSGDARFEGRQFVAQEVTVYHRSTNDMIVNAQQSLTGQIRSTGDVILVNTPPVVEVVQYYSGQLLYE